MTFDVSINVNLIGLRRSEKADLDDKKLFRQVINVPLPGMVINEGDLLWLVGSDEALAELPKK